MREAPLQARSLRRRASWKRQRAAQCFWTRWASWRPRFRLSCCACCRSANSSGSAARVQSKPTSAGAPGAKFHDTIREVKKQLVRNAMEHTQNNYVDAAKLLGLHPNNLHRLMKNLNLK